MDTTKTSSAKRATIPNHVINNSNSQDVCWKPPTVFGLGEHRAVLRAVLQYHTRPKQVWTALKLDAGFPAEVCHSICSADYFYRGPVTLSFIPEKIMEANNVEKICNRQTVTDKFQYYSSLKVPL